MMLKRHIFSRFVGRILFAFVFVGAVVVPESAFALNIVDSLDLTPVIPVVLEALMSVAKGSYDFFVGNGDGIIYVLIWTFMAFSIFLYLVGMYFPKRWVEFLGFSGGGEMWEDKISGFSMATTVGKTAVRALIAGILLLQIRPVYITKWLVNPFLEFGAYYSETINNMTSKTAAAQPEPCPQSVLNTGWISEHSCNFLMRPVHNLALTNNSVIKRGFQFLSRGLHELISPVPHGGQGFMNIITGLALIIAFVACNVFMGLLVIQGIFDFGMALVLYPFNVLGWVAKRNDKWFDVWPAFDGIVKALQKLVITMIACSFVLVINIAVVKALFHWDTSTFVVSAGGSASSNVPVVSPAEGDSLATNAINFGGHSILWLSSILTFFLMATIFNRTRELLKTYAPGMTGMYDKVRGDIKGHATKAKGVIDFVKKTAKFIKK
ncbi:MAG: hypothetical protein K5912_00350 [Alphaproteobacteria bacterium]|nr:hypothetical protein [Alphaproteobacteria bacterium]